MKALEALLDYEQADEEGVMVLASRQAIHEVAADLKRLVGAIQTYAAIQPLDLKIRDDLRAIAGQKHTHVRNIGGGGDQCLICQRDLRDEVHFRAALSDNRDNGNGDG